MIKSQINPMRNASTILFLFIIFHSQIKRVTVSVYSRINAHHLLIRSSRSHTHTLTHSLGEKSRVIQHEPHVFHPSIIHLFVFLGLSPPLCVRLSLARLSPARSEEGINGGLEDDGINLLYFSLTTPSFFSIYPCRSENRNRIDRNEMDRVLLLSLEMELLG